MNPNKSQWNVAQMSEYRARKKDHFGQARPVKRTEDYRPHADEAMALGNSWREEK
jgi:hypothetical protein